MDTHNDATRHLERVAHEFTDAYTPVLELIGHAAYQMGADITQADIQAFGRGIAKYVELRRGYAALERGVAHLELLRLRAHEAQSVARVVCGADVDAELADAKVFRDRIVAHREHQEAAAERARQFAYRSELEREAQALHPRAIVEAAQAQGVRLSAENGQIVVQPAGLLSGKVRQFVELRRDDIVAFLAEQMTAEVL